MAILAAHDWPGNVRELENEMRRVLLLSSEVVHLEHLSPRLREKQETDAGGFAQQPMVVGDLRASVASFERRAIEDALALGEGNKSRAARSLGISRFALQRKMEKYGIVGGADGPGDTGDAVRTKGSDGG